MNSTLLLDISLSHIPDILQKQAVANPLSGKLSNNYVGTIKVNNHEWNLCFDKDSDFWWVNPRPEPLFYEILYGKLFYNSPLPEQFGYASLETDGERRKIKASKNWDDIEKHISLIHKNSILEIGCGQGEFLLEAIQRGWKTAMGNELEKHSAQLAKNKGIEIFEGFFENMPELQKFDFVFADNVIEHSMNPLIFLKKCHSILHEGGYLVLRCPDTPPTGPALKLIDHTFHFSRKSMKLFLEKAGFKVITFFYSGTFYGLNFPSKPNDKIENMTVIATK